MNKWQIICPLAALMLVVVIAGLVLVRLGLGEHAAYVLKQTRMIGEELTRTTNSPRLVEFGPTLQTRLGEFLTPNSGVAAAMLGDQPVPVGDGTASSRLVLSNNAGGCLGIRLKQDAGPERFHILGLWSVTELQHGADPRQR